MLKSCTRCGKIHDSRYKCRATLNTYSYYSSDEYKLRNTNVWHKKSEEIRKKSNNLCSTCILEDIYTYDKLEVHHIVPVKEDKDKFLDNYNLICLCSKCHKKADKGEIDRELLLKIAKEREDGE